MSITIRRGPLPTDHFTMLSNDWIRDERLPWAARGLLAWIASHADGFRITEDSIIAAGQGGRSQVRSMTRALEETGYLKRERQAIVTGGSSVTYVLTDPREGENRPFGNGGKSPLRSDQEELFPEDSVSAGQGQGDPRGRFSPPRSTEEDQKKNKKTSSSTTKRGTRVPDDFEPTDEMKAWFVAEGLDKLIHGRTEHDKFMDFFRAAPGQKGVKLDWVATWRNWMRNAAQRNGYSRPVSAPPGNSLAPVSGLYAAPSGAHKPSTTDQKVAQTLELGRRLQQQMEETA